MRDTILAERGVTITFKRREIEIADIPAVPSKARALNEKSGEYRTTFVERVYTIELGLLTWNEQQVRPKPGDHIIEGDIVYEVTEDEMRQCYRPIDPNEMYVRLFVKRLTKPQ